MRMKLASEEEKAKGEEMKSEGADRSCDSELLI